MLGCTCTHAPRESRAHVHGDDDEQRLGPGEGGKQTAESGGGGEESVPNAARDALAVLVQLLHASMVLLNVQSLRRIYI